MKKSFVCIAATLAAAVSHAVDLTIPAGSPTVLSAEQSAVYYEKVYINDDLTIDGTDRGLTNSSTAFIGKDAVEPITVVVTNGAKWLTVMRGTIAFDGKGGTIVASSPSLPAFTWGSQIPVPPFSGNHYTNAFGAVGYNSQINIRSTAVADGGVMDILRILPNTAVSFVNVSNVNSAVAARILFEGGLNWAQNDSNVKCRFNVANNARIILESVNGNPIYIRSLAQNHKLFKGAGTLETRGDGDFVSHHNRTTADLRTITLARDEGGNIVWGHRGRTVLKGVATWKVGSDNILPYGPQTGPVVFSSVEYISGNHTPISLDLNGKTVRVNGILHEGYYSQYSMVTNSAAQTATLILGTNDVDGVLNGLFSDNIAIEKVGNGRLVVSNATVRGSLTVRAGSVSFVGDNSFANPVTFEDGVTLEMADGTADDSITKITATGDSGIPLAGNPRRVYVKQGSNRVDAYAGPDLDGADIAVEGGILRFTGSTSDKWWRFTVCKALSVYSFPKLVEHSTYEINMFALWPTNVTSSYRESKTGMNASHPWGKKHPLTYGLATNSTEFTSGMTSYSQLPAGTCMLGFGETCTEVDMDNSGRDYSGGADSLFQYGAVVCLASKGTTISEDDESSWQHVVWRLPDDAPVAASYGICRTYWSDGVWGWKLESSADGENWTLRDEHVADVNLDAREEGLTVAESSALSEFPLSSESMKNTASCMMWYNDGVPYHFTRGGTAAERLNGVKLSVASGATIDTGYLADSAISVAALRVDCENGGGTITKFRPAAGGTLELTSLSGSLPGRYNVPVALPSVLDAGNFATWSVTVDGTPSRATTLSWHDGVLVANTAIGTMIYLR